MSQTLVPEPSAATPREATLSRIDSRRRVLSAAAIWIVLVGLIIVASLVSDVFLTQRNLTVILKQAAPLGILAVGETIVLLTGGIDLSVASIMATTSIFAAGISNGSDENIGLVILLCLALAALVGFVNGLLVTKLKIPPFIATLGMILVVQGIRFVYTGGTPEIARSADHQGLGPGPDGTGSQWLHHLDGRRARSRSLSCCARPSVGGCTRWEATHGRRFSRVSTSTG